MKIKQSGLPYIGSKRLISEKLANTMISLKPNAKVFLDVFGGGASMSLMMLQKGFKVYYNELNRKIFTFFNFIINNDLPDYFYNFVDRNEFFKIIKSKPKTEEELIYKTFVEIFYSFGNKYTSYFCSKEKVELNKQKHLFIFNKIKTIPIFESRYKITGLSHLIPKLKTNDINKTRKNISNVIIKLEAIKCCIEYGDLNIKNFFHDFSFEDFLAFKQSDMIKLINKYCPNIPKKSYKTNIEQLQQCQNLERLFYLGQIKSLQELQHNEQLQRLELINGVKKIEKQYNSNLILLNHSYDDAEIQQIINSYNEDDLIIYFDPPYCKVDYYNNDCLFDYEKFKTYQKTLKKQFFLSEYNNVYDLIEIASFDKRQQFDSSKSKIVKEKLFTNKIIKQSL